VGTVHADMVLVSKLDTEPQSQRVCGRTEFQRANLSGLYDSTSISDLDFRFVQFLPKADVEVGQTTGIESSINLTGGPGSVSLCLYAMLGLGLCSAPHWIKKLSIGYIPEWYHNGGPLQIGHSLAVSPESLCPVPVYCFVQPVLATEYLIPQYHHMTVVSLWRKSQFTPDIIASRGPPLS
jgi:hypothetical protein